MGMEKNIIPIFATENKNNNYKQNFKPDHQGYSGKEKWYATSIAKTRKMPRRRWL